MQFGTIGQFLFSLLQEASIEALVTKYFFSHQRQQPSPAKEGEKEVVKEVGKKAASGFVRPFSKDDERLMIQTAAKLTELLAAEEGRKRFPNLEKVDIVGFLEWLGTLTIPQRNDVRDLFEGQDAIGVMAFLAEMTSDQREAACKGTGTFDPTPFEAASAAAKKLNNDTSEALAARVAAKRQRVESKTKPGFKALLYLFDPLPEVSGEELPTEGNVELLAEEARLDIMWELKRLALRLRVGGIAAVVSWLAFILIAMAQGTGGTPTPFVSDTLLALACANTIAVCYVVFGVIIPPSLIAKWGSNLLARGINALPGPEDFEPIVNERQVNEFQHEVAYVGALVNIPLWYMLIFNTAGKGIITFVFYFASLGLILFATNASGKWKQYVERLTMFLLALGAVAGLTTSRMLHVDGWDLGQMIWNWFAQLKNTLGTMGWFELFVVATLALAAVAHTKGKEQFERALKLFWISLLLLLGSWALSWYQSGASTSLRTGQYRGGLATPNQPPHWGCKSPALQVNSAGEFEFAATCPTEALGGEIKPGETMKLVVLSGQIKPKTNWGVVPDVTGYDLGQETAEIATQWKAQMKYPEQKLYAVLVVTSDRRVIPFGTDGTATIKNESGSPLAWSLFYNDEVQNSKAWSQHTGSIKFRVQKNP